jgi:hypothetical protein
MQDPLVSAEVVNVCIFFIDIWSKFRKFNFDKLRKQSICEPKKYVLKRRKYQITNGEKEREPPAAEKMRRVQLTIARSIGDQTACVPGSPPAFLVETCTAPALLRY